MLLSEGEWSLCLGGSPSGCLLIVLVGCGRVGGVEQTRPLLV